MQVKRYFTVSSLRNGNFNSASTRLDTTVNVSQPYQHPAITSNYQVVPDGSPYVGASIPGQSGTWTTLTDECIYTVTNGDMITLTSCEGFTLDATGILTSGMDAYLGTGIYANSLRNGGILDIFDAGNLVASVDLYNLTTEYTYIPLEGSTTITIVASGRYNPLIHPISTPIQTTGTSVVATLTAQSPATFNSGTWRILATSSTQYSLYFTPTGGSESLVASGLTAGVVDTSHVTGVNLLVNTGMTSGDQATFTTDYIMYGLLDVQLLTVTGSYAGKYTSEIFDTGDPGTEVPAMTWIQNIPIFDVLIDSDIEVIRDSEGNIIDFAATENFNSIALTPLNITLTDGTSMGIVGDVTYNNQIGRYFRWSVNFNPEIRGGWIRDVQFYYHNPYNDPHFLDLFAYGIRRQFNKFGRQFLGTLAVLVCDYRQAVDDLRNSYTLLGATDDYLFARGQDQALPQYTGEPPEAYQTRISTSFKSRSQGGSIGFICALAAQLVFGSPQLVSDPTYSGSYATVSANGLIVSEASGRTVNVTIPAPQLVGTTYQYIGLPNVAVSDAQTIITDYIQFKLRNIGTIINITYLTP